MDVLQKSDRISALNLLTQDSFDQWMQSSAVTASLSVGMLIAIVAMGGLVSRGALTVAKEATGGATELTSSSKPDVSDAK